MQRTTVPHQIWAVSNEWWRGMFFFSFLSFFSPRRGEMPHCLQTVPASHFFFFLFDKLVVRLLRLMHISQKSFLPSFLCDLPVGHDKSLRAPLDQTESFQDNANYDKFHHPALCAFPLISLIRESRGGSRCFSWGACCLIEWCWNRKTLNLRPPPPTLPLLSLPFPAVTTSSLLSFHISPLSAAASVAPAGNGSSGRTWPQKNLRQERRNAAERPFKRDC